MYDVTGATTGAGGFTIVGAGMVVVAVVGTGAPVTAGAGAAYVTAGAGAAYVTAGGGAAYVTAGAGAV